MTTELVSALPETGDESQWNDRDRALVEASGLVRSDSRGNKFLADRPFVEAFLMHCKRTNLDPIAKQIYAIYRGGRWGIQVSIDGMRLVAERSGKYEGQTPVTWSNDGKDWVEAWMPVQDHTHPEFARVGVYKAGFREPLYAVARWDAYAVSVPEYEGPRGSRKPTGRMILSDFWAKMPDLMLAKVCEALALRKAFPMELSGLYTTEEMDQANNGSRAPSVHQMEHVKTADEWMQQAFGCKCKKALRLLFAEIDRARALDLRYGQGESAVTLRDALTAQAETLPDDEPDEVVDAEVVNPDTGEVTPEEPAVDERTAQQDDPWAKQVA